MLIPNSEYHSICVVQEAVLSSTEFAEKLSLGLISEEYNRRKVTSAKCEDNHSVVRWCVEPTVYIPTCGPFRDRPSILHNVYYSTSTLSESTSAAPASLQPTSLEVKPRSRPHERKYGFFLAYITPVSNKQQERERELTS